jgi:hypothetical protein
MAQQNQYDRLSLSRGLVPLRLEGLCDELNRTAQMRLEHVVATIDRLAPRPGVLVHVCAHRLAIRISGFEPVVFSAIDANTLLQVAQVYLTTTTAAAVSFLDFVKQSLPFEITCIVTSREKPFVNSKGPELQRDFSAMARQMGVTHTVMHAPMDDTLFVLTSKLTFGGISEGLIANTTEGELQRELAHFLFFHNNYRSVPWLGGKTPIQKLGSFDGFSPIDAFDPYGSDVNRPIHNESL